MRSNLARAGIAIAVIAASVVLFVVLQDGDEDEASAPQTKSVEKAPQQPPQAREPAKPKPITVTVRNAKPVGGVERLEYAKGERVRFVVRSDVADEVHVHGYDRIEDVAAGGSVRFDFPATLEGVFEIELESRAEQIAELRVEPR